jgi:hypothetical protein
MSEVVAAIKAEVETGETCEVLKAVLQDNLIGGLGIARFRYKPTVTQEKFDLKAELIPVWAMINDRAATKEENENDDNDCE